MATPITNFGLVTVSTTYGAADTTIALTTGHGSRLPATTGGYTYPMTWWDSVNYPHPADDPNAEIVLVTARSADTLTVTRAYEGTSASTKNTGGATYRMSLGLTAAMHNALYTSKNTHEGLTLETYPSAASAADYVVVSELQSITMDDGTFMDNADASWIGKYATLSASGATGLDTGAESSSSWYEIYAIAKEDGTKNLLLHAAPYISTQAFYLTGDDSSQNIGSTSSNTFISQGFKLTNSGSISSVSAKLERAGTPSGYIIALIYSSSAGSPNAALVTAGYLLASDIPTTASWVRFNFPNKSMVLSASTQYHVLIGGSYTPNATDYIKWHMDSSSPSYADGQLHTWNGVSWTGDSAKDLLFYVDVVRGDTAVTMPTDYTKKCLLGYVYNNGSSIMRPFIQHGKTVRYKNISDGLVNGIDGSLQEILLDNYVPMSESRVVSMGCSGTGTAAGIVAVNGFDSPHLSIAPGDVSSTGAQAILFSGTASYRPSGFSDVIVKRSKCYAVGTNGCNLYVNGYTI